MITKPVKQIFPFRSKSDPKKSYECILYTDNTTSCNCPGWTRRVAANGTRECKHTQMVEGGLDGGRATQTILSTKKAVAATPVAITTGRRFNFDE